MTDHTRSTRLCRTATVMPDSAHSCADFMVEFEKCRFIVKNYRRFPDSVDGDPRSLRLISEYDCFDAVTGENITSECDGDAECCATIEREAAMNKMEDDDDDGEREADRGGVEDGVEGGVGGARG